METHWQNLFEPVLDVLSGTIDELWKPLTYAARRIRARRNSRWLQVQSSLAQKPISDQISVLSGYFRPQCLYENTVYLSERVPLQPRN